jgi:hypothetical protein
MPTGRGILQQGARDTNEAGADKREDFTSATDTKSFFETCVKSDKGVR